MHRGWPSAPAPCEGGRSRKQLATESCTGAPCRGPPSPLSEVREAAAPPCPHPTVCTDRPAGEGNPFEGPRAGRKGDFGSEGSYDRLSKLSDLAAGG